MRGDLDDLVGAAREPDVAVLVDMGRVAGRVDARDPLPVVASVPLRLAPQASAVRPGNGRLMTMIPFSPAGSGWPSGVTTAASMPGSGMPAEPGLIGSRSMPYGLPNTGPPVSVCHM